MNYKYVKAILCFGRLIDLDNGNIFLLNSSRFCYTSGYYTLKRVNDTMWKVVKQVWVPELWTEGYIQSLPLFVKSTISNFLLKNYGIHKWVQSFCKKLKF